MGIQNVLSPFICDCRFRIACTTLPLFIWVHIFKTNLFHRFARAYDRDAAVAGPILESIVDGPGRRHDGAIRVGQLIEALFDDEAYQSIGVELEVTARGVSKIKHGIQIGISIRVYLQQRREAHGTNILQCGSNLPVVEQRCFGLGNVVE